MSGELFIGILFITFLIFNFIYNLWRSKTHNYMCDNCKHQIPITFNAPIQGKFFLGMPKIKCPNCGKTSYFEVVKK
jgi:DNA-directed RNA polymerase subunit RPC12/RpoP